MPSNDDLDRRVRRLEAHATKPNAITRDQYRATAERIRLRAHATLRQSLGLPFEGGEGDAEADEALIAAWRDQEKIPTPDGDRRREELFQAVLGYGERTTS